MSRGADAALLLVFGLAQGCGHGASADGAGGASSAGAATGGSSGSSGDSGTPDASVGGGGASGGSDAGPPMPPETDASVVNPPAGASGPYLWKNVAIVGGGFVTGVVFSPVLKDLVYARTDIGGTYRYNPVTQRWMPITDFVARDQVNFAGTESIAADPIDANRVYLAVGTYVASGNGAFLRSDDQGQTFSASNAPFPIGSNNDGRSVGERLAIDPNSTSVLYFGSRQNGLWKSGNAAQSWVQVSAFPAVGAAGIGLSFVQFDPRSGSPGQPSQVIYVGVTDSAVGLYRSTDAGATWQPVPGQPSGLMPSHAALAYDGMLYLSYGNGAGPNNVTNGAVFRLDTHSDTWTDVTPVVPSAATGLCGYGGVTVDATHPGSVMVSTIDRWATGDEIFRTTDSGAHWSRVGPTAQRDGSAAPWVYWHRSTPSATGWMGDIDIDPFDSNHVLYVTGQGIWGSDDVGQLDSNQPTHWDFRSVGIEETAVRELASPASGARLLSAVGDIGGFRHDDLDVSPADGMSDNPIFANTTGLDFAGASDSVVARVGTSSAQHGSYSLDGGATWTPFPSEPANATTGGTIAVSADGSRFVWSVGGGVQVSSNRGATWLPATGTTRAAVADRVNPNLFYAFGGGALSRSTDGGATFATTGASGLPAGNGGRLRATPGVEGDLWLASARGLFHITASGTAVAPISTVTVATAIGFGQAAPGQSFPALYLIGTVNAAPGLFRSDDAGVSWTRIDDPAHRFATAGIVIGDPRQYGRVYVGTNGRGIFYGDPAP